MWLLKRKDWMFLFCFLSHQTTWGGGCDSCACACAQETQWVLQYSFIMSHNFYSWWKIPLKSLYYCLTLFSGVDVMWWHPQMTFLVELSCGLLLAGEKKPVNKIFSIYTFITSKLKGVRIAKCQRIMHGLWKWERDQDKNFICLYFTGKKL